MQYVQADTLDSVAKVYAFKFFPGNDGIAHIFSFFFIEIEKKKYIS